MSNKKITQERLKEVLHYDSNTGVFIWNVSASNYVKVGNVAGCVNTNGYRVIKIDWKIYGAHRLAWLYIYGYFPENQIDHINRNRSDNRIINLREASHTCNARNSKVQSNNKSGITGIGWNKRGENWKARIIVGNKHIHLGYFASKTEAAKARWNAEVKHGFPNCNTTSSAYLYLKGAQNV